MIVIRLYGGENKLYINIAIADTNIQSNINRYK